MVKRMERLNFIEAVAALALMTKPDPEDPYVVDMDMDERPFISRPGVNQRRIVLTRGRLYNVRVTDYDGHHNVWSEPDSPYAEDVLANDWEVWTC
ncbi:hypothetical protein [Selenomonas ruminantium]|uniref:hypothetical protein n=1 Tax=Selenomonas ruminantium TaxID=971 RepID=UPI0026E9999D|nr:hypothetical protein [Selenomonas ruminantium]